MAESDLAELRKQCITSLYLCTDNISKYLDDEKEQEFHKLKSYVENYCLLEAQQGVAIQALETVKRETDASNIDSLEDRFASQLSSMAGKKLNVNRHPYMTELHKRYENGIQRNNNLDDSDIAITQSHDQYHDPITKKPLVDPLKNIVCGHIYEKSTILEILRTKNIKCPVVGCGNKNPIQENQLVADEELKFRLTITQHSTMIEDRSTVNLDFSME